MKIEWYTLSAENMRAPVMRLNEEKLRISGISDLPEMLPEKQEVGIDKLAPGSCTFFVM